MKSRVTNQFQVTVSVTLCWFRPSESLFGCFVLVVCVGSDISSSHLLPCLHWHFMMDRQLERSRFIDEALVCCVLRGEPLVYVQ